MESRISLITLGVADINRSIRFYRDGFGFPTASKEGDPIAIFRMNGTRLALYPFQRLAENVAPGFEPSKGGFGGIALSHNARKKEDVSRILDLAEKAGGRIVKPAEDTFWGGQSGCFSDPDGYFWEVIWGPMLSFGE